MTWKSTRSTMFRIALLACFMAIAPAVSAQAPSQLNKAFEKRSIKLLKEFIHQADDLSEIKPSNDTIATVNALLNAFILHMCNESEAVNFRAYRQAAKQRPQYLVLQPQVETGFAESQEFDFAVSFKYTNKRGGIESPMFVHKGVFGYFLSAGYYEFDTLFTREMEPYMVDNGPVGNFVPWIADTAIVHRLNIFLKDKERDHMKRVKFLSSFLPVFGGAHISRLNTYGQERHHFTYSFFIDRIVFNPKMNDALIQYSTEDRSAEVHFRRPEDGEGWKKVKEIDVLEI